MYQDCLSVFHKIITPAYLLYRSGPVAIYYSEISKALGPVANVCRGGGKIIVTRLVGRLQCSNSISHFDLLRSR